MLFLLGVTLLNSHYFYGLLFLLYSRFKEASAFHLRTAVRFLNAECRLIVSLFAVSVFAEINKTILKIKIKQCLNYSSYFPAVVA